MDCTTKNSIRTVGEVFNGSTFKSLLVAYNNYGFNSPEFKQAQLNHQKRMAAVEANHQIRKAGNQAKLYERGY